MGAAPSEPAAAPTPNRAAAVAAAEREATTVPCSAAAPPPAPSVRSPCPTAPEHSTEDEPDAVAWPNVLPCFPPRPQFQKQIGDTAPFLRLRREKSKLYDLHEALFVVVENISDFPVLVMPRVCRGRFMKGEEDMVSQLLFPGQTYQLTRLSTDKEHYRMDCYASGLPHFPCNGVSKRVDPTCIAIVCQPAFRDSNDWEPMGSERGLSHPEGWVVYIDHLEDCYVKFELMRTCKYVDDRRPLKMINTSLDGIRYCQDSCGTTFRDGRSLKATVKELKDGTITVADLGIRVVEFGSIYFALDNRRLRCAKQAFPSGTHPKHSVAVLLADLRDPRISKEWEAKFTAGTRIATHEEVRKKDRRGAHESTPAVRQKQQRQARQTPPMESPDVRPDTSVKF
ncbi:unnamed protein product [Prorocentrum cordatum]|uniref:Altered inheritance of mitochondria protein 24, mitochondrial n=1 Tax=Prorocentrum cordatum TaxID=2364126 RepID=A0ABN9PCY9_9DINO|nr:unnamed protein product [Polarella glacialis]